MIYIHKGDDTDFNDNSFLTFNVITEKDLTGWQAKFILNGLEKTFEDITSKSFELHYSDEETSQFKLGKTTNELRLIDEEGKIKTVAKNIEISITSDVIENKSQLINLPILKDEGIDINISLASNSGGGGGTANHFELLYRDMANQHPIKAITNLQETLDKKANKDELPTKTSQLINDSSFATESFVTNKIAEAELGGGEVDLSGLATKDELNSKQDIITDLEEIRANATNAIKDVSNLATKEELEAKQNTLVSGTNIKTINNQSILGSGNITIEGGSGGNVGTGLEGKITNCLTEIPQRIKYTLNNGTLTLKAGSVVIFPYGTENLTSQYPKGATFLHENLKVYDTQFTDNKFFVWVELQEDISNAPTSSDAKLGFIRLFFFSQNNEVRLERAVSTFSLSTIGTQSALIYNTTKNKIAYHSSGKPSNDIDIDAFPIGLCRSNGTYKFGTVAQIFDGIGYIGSIVWANKGVKGLAPNGKNEDGTLNNIEFVTDKLNIITISADKHLCLNETGLTTHNTAEYDEKQNALITNNGIKNSVYVGQVKWSDRITSFASTKIFRAVDYNQIDGQWVMKEFAVMSSFPKSEQDFDLTDYLPNDGHVYEVMVSAYGATSATSGNAINVFIGSDLIGCDVCLFSATTRTTSNVTGGGTAIIPARNKITVSNTGTASSGNNSLKLLAYRRMGINS